MLEECRDGLIPARWQQSLLWRRLQRPLDILRLAEGLRTNLITPEGLHGGAANPTTFYGRTAGVSTGRPRARHIR